MSVMALSSQVGAPSSSFVGADKSLELSREAKPHTGQTYQGGAGQAVSMFAAQTVGLNAPKLEANGALEPSLHSLSPVINQAIPAGAVKPSISLLSGGNLSSLSPSITDTGLAQTAIMEFDTSLSSSVQRYSNNASFNLLTGPRSIAGMREGQIAASPTTSTQGAAILSASGVSLAAFSGVNSTIADSTIFGSAIGTTIGTSTGLTNSFPASLMGEVLPSFVTPSVDSSGTNSGASSVMSPFAADMTASGVTGINSTVKTVNDVTGSISASSPSSTSETVSPNSGKKSNPKQSNPKQQFNAIFGRSETISGQTNTDESTSAVQTKDQQVKDEQTQQAREKTAQEQKQKQQALAAIFAKEAQQAPAQQSQEETKTREQELAKEHIKQAQEKVIEQHKAQVEALKSRDSEVKAHEHAHATVGGQYAQSPSFKYEKGADGQRYATDGEVQIDVSIVPGDPLATINKMKQVYAAAMAPVDPSSADIRVAAEALKKMNEARTKLAEERQQQVADQQTTETLIGAQAQIEGLPPLKERQIQVTGEVDAQGNIAAPQDEPSSPVTDVIDKIKQAITAQIASSKTSDAIDGTAVDTTDTIEPPTATLAIDLPQAAEDNGTQPLTNTVASLTVMTSSSQDLLQTGRSAMRFYGSVAFANLTNSDGINVSRSGVNTQVAAAITHSEEPKNQSNSEQSSKLTLDSPHSQDTRGLFNAQTLALHRPRFLDVSV
ncbi:MAG: putative metalloprotease CJM1_0395 family protein [Shewanella sp.]